MKNLITFIVMLIFSGMALSAAPARVVYYIMNQTTESVCDDSVLSVEFDITSPMIFSNEAGYVHPQPQITVILTNKSDSPLRLNVNESKLMRNSHAQKFNDFLSGGELVLAPHSSISFDNIPLLTEEAAYAFNNIYHHRHLKVLKNDYGMLCFGNLDKAFSEGSTVSYRQDNSPVYIGTSFVYSIGEDETLYNIETMYYAMVKAGSTLNAIGQEKAGLIDEVYPDWMNPKYEVFKMWCFNKK